MKGNPAGILMIGIGVVLLNLAYTGRGKAVWEALSGNYSGEQDGQPKAKPPTTGTAPPPDTDPKPPEPQQMSAPRGAGMGGDAGTMRGLFYLTGDDFGLAWGAY